MRSRQNVERTASGIIAIEHVATVVLASLFLISALFGMGAGVAARRRQIISNEREIDNLRNELRELKEQAAARARAEAASEAKSRFLATVSHEVRTPLNGILGLAELLRDVGLNAEQLSYVDAIHTSGTALASLIEEILDFSKIEAGKLELSQERFDLPGLVEGVVELIAPRAQGKGLEIAAAIAQAVPQSVVGDADRLRQVLLNLAGNGVKFTERGGVGISVSSQPNDRVLFTVADTGPGVAEHRQSAIFDDFEQADGSTTRRHEGTGLGLAISKRIVERMGGTLGLHCPPEGGAVFSFTVSLPATPETLAHESCVNLLGQQALIVAAQSPFQAPFLAARMAELGALVNCVPTLAEALAELCKRPDIVVVDCAIGEEHAHRLAEAARAAGARLCLVLFSPFERRSIGRETVQGFDGWLVKPVRRGSLLARLGDQAACDIPLAAPKPLAAGGLRVLLAEDNEINALLARKALARLGADVVHARDGVAALQMAEAALARDAMRFDAILMDIRMPGLDGHEVCRRIRSAESATQSERTRIIALTANAFDEDRQACLTAGIDAFLTKPVDLARLAQALAPATINPTQAA
jgi:signal transduction histidine kinase/CheY-like chemotaxis protein